MPNSFIVSHIRLRFATKELTHVLMLPISSSLHLKTTSRYTMAPELLTFISLTMVVFLFLVSVKGGSTSIDRRAASA